MSDLEVETIDSVASMEKSRWNTTVDRSPAGTLFHSYEYIKALEKGYPGKPCHTVVTRDGNLAGFMPNFLHETGIPGMKYLTSYHGRGGPVITSNEEEVLTEMISNSQKIAGKTNAVFQDISSPNLYSTRYNSIMLDNGYKTHIGITRKVIDLKNDLGKIKSNIKNRSKRKRFEKFKDAEVEIFKPDKSDLTEFYRFYKKYQERDEITTKKIDFFTQLNQINDKLRIGRCTKDGKVSGEHLYLVDEEKSHIHHLFTGMGDNYREFNATERIHRKMIEWSKNKELETYDFGKNSADFRKGVFNFKDEYGAKNRPIMSWRKIFSKPRYQLYRFATKFN